METKTGTKVGVSLPLVVASLVVVVLAVAIALHYRSEQQASLAGATITVTSRPNTPSIISEKDTDGDGLRDWEEALWNTDSNNQDTDGDGTNDGEEVLLYRDPTLSGPDDSLNSLRIITDPVHSNEPDTATKQFSRKLFTSFVSVGGTVERLSEQNIATLVSGLESSLINERPSYDTYNKFDLNIVESNVKTVDKYRTDLLKTLTQYNADLINEMFELQQLLTTKSDTSYSRIKEVQHRYESMTLSLLSMKVPADAVVIHLKILNAMSGLSATTALFLEAHTDPIRAIAATRDEESILSTLEVVYSELGAYFVTHGYVVLET